MRSVEPQAVCAALLVIACVAQVWAGAVTTPAADETDVWLGEYVFEEDGGKTAGGSAIYVVHTLTIMREGREMKARLESNGYQTYVALECEAQASTGRMRLTFVRHADEHVFLRGDYRPGDHLLTLVRDRTRLLTYWGKFRPQFRRPRQGRVYFREVASRQ